MTIQKRSRITIWSVLALLVAAGGAASSLVVARLWILKWASSGERFPIGSLQRVSIPEDRLESLVYYESSQAVGSRFMKLFIRDEHGDRHYPKPADEDNQFAVAGLQGRSLFRLDLLEQGEYAFRCDNPNYASDGEIPEADRVVFLKDPDTRREALGIRRLIILTGGTLTIILTIALYVVHGITLARRHAASSAEAPTDSG